jgi:hypothetical protein
VFGIGPATKGEKVLHTFVGDNNPGTCMECGSWTNNGYQEVDVSLFVRAIPRIDPKTALQTSNTFKQRRYISEQTAQKFWKDISPVVPHIKKQGAVDCEFTCKDIMLSIHKVPPFEPIGFWDQFKTFFNGVPPGYKPHHLSLDLPKTEVEYIELLERFGPFVMKAQKSDNSAY